jgi:hypothetical protein
MTTAMTTALIAGTAPEVIVYAASLVFVIWAVVDVARRSPQVMPVNRKAAWIVGLIVGWLFLGVIGAAVAVFYLYGPRRRLNVGRL